MGAIVTIRDFGIALKHGPYTSVGGYPVYFVTADGGALSFATAWNERSNIVDAINGRGGDKGWRVVALEVNWENAELYDDHTGERIESAYAEDDAVGAPEATPEGYRHWFKRVREARAGGF